MNKRELDGSRKEIDVYLQEIASYPRLLAAQEKELGLIIRNGNEQAKKEAIKELVESNLGLVIFIIKKRYLGCLNGKIKFFDLIQAGNEGLLKAAKRYDPMNYNNKFSTYASQWIRPKIHLAIEEQKEIPIRDYYCWTKLNQIKKIRYDHFKENGCWPTTEWITERIGIPVEKVNQLLQIPKTIISLENPVGNDNNSLVSDFIPDENCLNPEESALKKEKKEFKRELPRQINKALNSLSHRKEVVLRKHFNIGEKRKHTLQEIGNEFKVTKQRIKIIEEEALQELRQHYKKRRLLEDFVE